MPDNHSSSRLVSASRMPSRGASAKQRPSPFSCPFSGPLPGRASRWWTRLQNVCLLVAPAATLVGCGTLGGLPTSGLGDRPASQHLTATSQPPSAAAEGGPLPSPPPYQADQADQADPAARSAPMAPVVQAAAYQAASPLGNSCPSCPAPHGMNGACGCAYPAHPTGAYRNAQEYIFDGGDQPPEVVVRSDWSTVGVAPSDTVIHYETLGGQVCSQASNRVGIYAPRFGAVRQVSGLQLSMQAIGTERILAPLAAEGFEEQNLASSVSLPVAPHGEEQVGLIDAFQEHYGGVPMEQVLPLSRMSAARVPFEWVALEHSGLITRKEMIEIHHLIQNAETWVLPEALMVEIANQPALAVKDTQAPEDYVVYETPDRCSMRIYKAASHTIANPGDIVSFAIRFDNAGVKPVGNVVITDSLAPRLNYIEGSQQCSLGVRFTAEPNEVGSMVLRWEIEDPLEPSQGGAITFDCLVR